MKVRPGDVMIVRTGRWARRDAKGPWPVSQGLAGLHMACAEWMHKRGVAIIGGDGAQDVLPSGVTGIPQPIHTLCIVIIVKTPFFISPAYSVPRMTISRDSRQRSMLVLLVMPCVR